MTWPLDWYQWVAFAAFGAMSLAMWASLNLLYRRVMPEDGELPGPRTRRLYLRRLGVMTGWWQITVGLCLVTLGGQWGTAIALFGMGGMFLFGSRLAKRYRIAPWWAPES